MEIGIKKTIFYVDFLTFQLIIESRYLATAYLV